MTIDNNIIQALLFQRQKAGANIVDYSLHDHGDGNGVMIGKWDEAKLGPLPTTAELDAAAAVKLPKVDRLRGIEERLEALERKVNPKP